MDLNELELIGVTQWKFPVALATETIETHPDLDHWELAKR